MHVLLAEDFNPKLARRLVKRGADINHIDKNGNSLLIKLVQLKLTKLVQFILDYKGKVLQHLVDDQGKDACDYAKENGLALEIPTFMSCSLKAKKHDQMCADGHRKDASFGKRSSVKILKQRRNTNQSRDPSNESVKYTPIKEPDSALSKGKSASLLRVRSSPRKEELSLVAESTTKIVENTTKVV